MRLDQAAARLFPDYSRARLQAWLAQGRLKWNDAVAPRARDKVEEGDRLELVPEPAPPGEVQAQDLPIEVVWHDAHLAIVHKPAGLTVHPGAGQSDGTLQNALLHRFPGTAQVPRAGIVHRLDKDTSGLLAVALTLPAHTALVRSLQAREFGREYDAIVCGVVVAGGTVDAPIGRDPGNRTRMSVLETGREAVSHYRVLEKFRHHTHLRVQLETGRTHQIRVHMQHERHPIVGDPQYGVRGLRTPGLTEALRVALAGFRRQALHARLLRLEHPITGKELAFEAEPPADLRSLLAVLRADARSAT